jgi:hypothetical protein
VYLPLVGLLLGTFLDREDDGDVFLRNVDFQRAAPLYISVEERQILHRKEEKDHGILLDCNLLMITFLLNNLCNILPVYDHLCLTRNCLIV